MWWGQKWKKEANHRCGEVKNEKRRQTTGVVGSKMKKGGKPQVWWGQKWKKEANHRWGEVKNEKRRQTTGVVRSKMKKGGKPQVWWGQKWKKEANHRCGGVQNEKSKGEWKWAVYLKRKVELAACLEVRCTVNRSDNVLKHSSAISGRLFSPERWLKKTCTNSGPAWSRIKAKAWSFDKCPTAEATLFFKW